MTTRNQFIPQSFLYNTNDNFSYIATNTKKGVKLFKFEYEDDSIQPVKTPKLSNRKTLEHQLICSRNQILLFDKKKIHYAAIPNLNNKRGFLSKSQWLSSKNVVDLDLYTQGYQCFELEKNVVLVFGCGQVPKIFTVGIEDKEVKCYIEVTKMREKDIGNELLSFTPNHIYSLGKNKNIISMALWNDERWCICHFDVENHGFIGIDKNMNTINSLFPSITYLEDIQSPEIEQCKYWTHSDNYRIQNPVVILQGLTNFVPSEDIKKNQKLNFQEHVYRILRKFESSFKVVLNYRHVYVSHIAECKTKRGYKEVLKDLNDKVIYLTRNSLQCDGLIYVYVGSCNKSYILINGTMVHENVVMNNLCIQKSTTINGISKKVKNEIPKIFVFAKHAFDSEYINEIKTNDFVHKKEIEFKSYGIIYSHNSSGNETYKSTWGETRFAEGFLSMFKHIEKSNQHVTLPGDLEETLKDHDNKLIPLIDFTGASKTTNNNDNKIGRIDILPSESKISIPTPLLMENDVIYNFGFLLQDVAKLRKYYLAGRINTDVGKDMRLLLLHLNKVFDKRRYLAQKFNIDAVKDKNDLDKLLLYLKLHYVVYWYKGGDGIKKNLTINTNIYLLRKKFKSIEDILNVKKNNKLFKTQPTLKDNFWNERDGYLHYLKKGQKELPTGLQKEEDKKKKRKEPKTEEKEEKLPEIMETKPCQQNETLTSDLAFDLPLNHVYLYQEGKQTYNNFVRKSKIEIELKSLEIEKKEAEQFSDILVKKYRFSTLFDYKRINEYELYNKYKSNAGLFNTLNNNIKEKSSALVLQLFKLFHENVERYLQDKQYKKKYDNFLQEPLHLFIVNCIQSKLHQIRELTDLNTDSSEIHLNLFSFYKNTKSESFLTKDLLHLNNINNTSGVNLNNYNTGDSLASQILREWKLERYTKIFIEQGFDDVAVWPLLEEKHLKEYLKMNTTDAKSFLRLIRARIELEKYIN